MPNDGDLQQFVLQRTVRQREVLELVSQGLSNPEVGSILFITSSTVAEHLTIIFAEAENSFGFAEGSVNRLVLISIFAPFFSRHPQFRNTDLPRIR